MNLTEMQYRSWNFEIQGEKQIFGKTKVEITRDEIEEIFFIEEDFLSEKVCERLFENYLYIYGD